MFNVLISIYQLCILTLFSFFAIYLVRKIFIKRKKFILLYHITLFIALFMASVVGGSVQNDSYKRLEKFLSMEKNNELELAKKNAQNYDSMFQIDLKSFNNSSEFKDYLKENDNIVDKAEAMFIGWIFVFLAELTSVLTQIIISLRNFKKNASR